MSEPDLTGGKTRPGFFLHVVPAVLYVAAVFYSGAVRITLPHLETLLPEDKVAHFFVFGVMVFVAFHAIGHELPKWTRGRLIVVSVIVASALGALLELIQLSIPYRDAEFLDWVADTLGALLAAGVLGLLGRWTSAPVTLEPAARNK